MYLTTFFTKLLCLERLAVYLMKEKEKTYKKYLRKKKIFVN